MCSSFAFGTVFFLSKNYNAGQIGVVLAVASILSVPAQSVAAAFADRSARVSMKQFTLVLAAAGAFLAALRFFFSNLPVAPAVLFILEQAVMNALEPLVNSLGVQAMNRGAQVNFGLSRGIGSITYAGVSVALGLFLKSGSCYVLPLFSVVLYAAFAVSVVKFPDERCAQVQGKAAFLGGPGRGGTGSAPGDRFFARENWRFFLLLAAVVLTFCSFIMTSSYLIQIMERVGGTAENVGIANGLAAAIELPGMVLFGVLIKKFRSGSILQAAFAVFVLKALAIMLSPNVASLYAAQILQFGSYALFIPASVYYVNEIVPEKDLAKGQAALTSAFAVGGVGANLIGGWLLDAAGVVPMLLAGVLVAAGGWLLGAFSVRKKA